MVSLIPTDIYHLFAFSSLESFIKASYSMAIYENLVQPSDSLVYLLSTIEKTHKYDHI